MRDFKKHKGEQEQGRVQSRKNQISTRQYKEKNVNRNQQGFNTGKKKKLRADMKR